jgi:hypothetical protein
VCHGKHQILFLIFCYQQLTADISTFKLTLTNLTLPMKKFFYAMIPAFLAVTCYGQNPSARALTLEDMSGFKPQSGNWQIVGDVIMNPTVDIHHEPEELPVTTEKGKKKKKADAPAVVEQPKAVMYQDGKGILLNINDATKKDNLVTSWEHGNIELELDVMLPKGSNSGIYLQGRYEVQLFDSWGVKDPKFSDIGGIYRNWESEAGKVYMGKAPLSNPSKAPGLWQNLKISFRAPKFDASGKKISNALFESVILNGVKIHDHVEVPLPTGGPVENNEKATGPLMIQGDHGPVAFRNFKYKLMKDPDVTLSNVTYKTFYGNYKTVADYASLEPVATGSLTEITNEILEKENSYGTIYNASFTVPEETTYEFVLRFTGGGIIKVDGQELINIQRADAWVDNAKSIALKAGAHTLEIQNYKDVEWMPPLLGIWIQSATMYPKALHSYSSFPPVDNPVSPILISPGSQPKLLPAFLDFKGDRKQRLTHTIGVGDPSGINYVYDLRAGNLVCVWRGNFVDATPMWNDRGDGSFRPLGATQYLFTSPPLAALANQNAAFPETGNDTDFRGKGYSIEENSGRPVFKYIYKGLEVESKVYPENENKQITHEITLKNRTDQTGLYFKLAEGSAIFQMADGSYAIDDKQYYVKVSGSVQPVIRDGNNKKELIIPVDGSTLKYSVIW